MVSIDTDQEPSPTDNIYKAHPGTLSFREKADNDEGGQQSGEQAQACPLGYMWQRICARQ